MRFFVYKIDTSAYILYLFYIRGICYYITREAGVFICYEWKSHCFLYWLLLPVSIFLPDVKIHRCIRRFLSLSFFMCLAFALQLESDR